MTEFSWKIERLQAIPQVDSLEKIVSRVIATYTATSEDGMVASQLVNVTTGPFSAEAFVAYEDLTQETVIGWIEAQMGEEGVANLRAMLEEAINDQRNIYLAPPWESE